MIRVLIDNALQREDGLGIAPAVQCGETEQIVERRIAGFVIFHGFQQVVSLLRLARVEQRFGFAQRGIFSGASGERQKKC